MAKYGNENAAAGGLNKDTASRDRSYGGGFGSDRNDRNNPYDSRFANPRYAQSMGVARPATLGNLAALGGMALPGGSIMTASGAVLNGTFDPFSGPQASRTNFSYDAPNRAGIGMTNPQGMGGAHINPFTDPRSPFYRPPGVAHPVPQAPLQLQQATMPSKWLSIGGPSPYGVSIPQYGYYPGKPQPKSMIMGGL